MPGSREPESPPRSPPRPCELTLSIPAFELPDPSPSKVRKPHIALNDQLLLSEEEDRTCHEMELSHKHKSHSFPPMCELDIDMAYSTSSPSLSSVSSITPSSPDRAQMEDGGAQMVGPIGLQGDVGLTISEKEVTVEIAKVGPRVGVQFSPVEGHELVEKWVEQDLIKNVERKCDMITKVRSILAEEDNVFGGTERFANEEKCLINKQCILSQDVSEETACEVVKVTDDQSSSEEQRKLIELGHEVDKGGATIEEVNGEQGIVETLEAQITDMGSEERFSELDRMVGTVRDLQCKIEGGLCDSEGLTCGTSGEDQAAEDQVVARLSPQAWVEALNELQPSESGSNDEEEEEDKDKEITEEGLGSPLEEVKKEEGSEDKEEGEEIAESRVQEVLDQVQQAEKEVCSIAGWHSDSSSINVEPPTPGRSVSSDLLDRCEG